MSSLLGLDRKAMEQARLERLAPKKRAAPDAIPEEVQRKKVALSPGTLQYPNGVIKRTWASGHERKNDVRFEEILQDKSTLKTALISSWQWDFDWLAKKLNPSPTKFIFVMEAKAGAPQEEMRADFAGMDRVQLCFPPMSRSWYARMHSKLMLLFHRDYLRIAVPSANPVAYDYGDTGSMENSAFLIDLPRLPEDSRGTAADANCTRFHHDLADFLKAQTVPANCIQGLLNFDWRQTQNYSFVHSIPGHECSGIKQLAQLIRERSPTPLAEAMTVECAASSIGSLDLPQIGNLYRALHGLNPVPGKIAAHKYRELFGDVENSFRIVYPSGATVQRSAHGANGAGTIFLRSEAYEKDSFPKKSLRDYISTRTGVLSHNKLFLVRTPTQAFMYTGSANLSQAAWGRVKTNGAVTMTNWECGVLAWVDLAGRTEMEAELDVDGVVPMEVFKSIYDVPFQHPAKEYDDDDRPWCASG